MILLTQNQHTQFIIFIYLFEWEIWHSASVIERLIIILVNSNKNFLKCSMWILLELSIYAHSLKSFKVFRKFPKIKF